MNRYGVGGTSIKLKRPKKPNNKTTVVAILTTRTNDLEKYSGFLSLDPGVGCGKLCSCKSKNAGSEVGTKSRREICKIYTNGVFLKVNSTQARETCVTLRKMSTRRSNV
ncbi:unnamed protein product [Macrosiphum euphorbiae]|uniref:Uncharacterized protein n=1 Tax=Macrosiphum euphorbiae TaxID=13131 RepID=A0AAV0W211_9HEMI|nr:unnamed protein product [Macrosiphum euphorbiae]